MSYLVKKPIPEYCLWCPFIERPWTCALAHRCIPNMNSNGESKRPDWCPLSEVPRSHGRLIELTPLLKNVNTLLLSSHSEQQKEILRVIQKLIVDATTVIAAEDEV